MKLILEEELRNYEYEHSTATEKTQNLTQRLRDVLKNNKDINQLSTRIGSGDNDDKKTDWERYKIVVQVVMGEIKGQGLRIMSKCLWHEDYDNYVSYTYKNVC